MRIKSRQESWSCRYDLNDGNGFYPRNNGVKSKNKIPLVIVSE